MPKTATKAPAPKRAEDHLPEIIRYILTLAAPCYAAPPAPLAFGVCRSCGQVITIEGEDIFDTDAAGDYATGACDCAEAIRWQSMSRAERSIDDLFGGGCVLYGKEALDDDAIEALNMLAKRVCNGTIDKANIEVTGGDGTIKARIAISSKGVVGIDRTDTQKTQRSV